MRKRLTRPIQRRPLRAYRRLDWREAGSVQTRLLPPGLPGPTNLECKASVHEYFPVGGDFYSFIPLKPSRLGIALGDVSGKGITAALVMANLMGRLETIAQRRLGLVEMTTQLNCSMYRALRAEQYATLFYGIYDEERGTLDYVNAGHYPPMLFSTGGSGLPQRLASGGAPIGLFRDASFAPATARLRSDDLLVLFSDGLIEAQKSDGERYGEARIIQIVDQYKLRSAAEIHRRLLDSLGNSSNGGFQVEDDLSLLVARVGARSSASFRSKAS